MRRTHKALWHLLFTAVVSMLTVGWAVTASAGDFGSGGSNEDLCDANASGGQSAQSGDVCSNYGDNDGSADQRGDASSGDGVAGQVVGVVSAGDTSVDASNRTEDATVDTGDATGTNEAHLDVGHDIAFLAGGSDAENNDLCVTEAEGGFASNSGDACVNDGENDGTIDQLADVTSGDGVAGQVAGVVTSAGGSADLVLANESEDVDVDTGDADFDNFADVVVGHNLLFEVVGGEPQFLGLPGEAPVSTFGGPGEPFILVPGNPGLGCRQPNAIIVTILEDPFQGVQRCIIAQSLNPPPCPEPHFVVRTDGTIACAPPGQVTNPL